MGAVSISSDRAVAALAAATAAFVSMPLAVLSDNARAETPAEVRRRVLRRIPSDRLAPRVVTRVEPVEYVRICDAFGSRFYYIPGADTCLRIGGYVRYEVSGASGENPEETSSPEPVEYVRICDLFGAGFYYIPGTDTCLKVGGRVRTTVYGASGYYEDEDEDGGGPIGYEFFLNSSIGRATGARQFFLATEFGMQLTLGAIQYEPRGLQSDVDVGGQLTIGDTGSFFREGMFFRWDLSRSVFEDNESLGSLNLPTMGLGIPGTGDPNANFPAGVLINAPTAANDLRARFDWSSYGAGAVFGQEFSAAPNITLAPFGGFEWMWIKQSSGLTFTVPLFPGNFSYDTDLDITRKSLVAGAEFTWAPNLNLGGIELEYYVLPTFYWDCLEFDGTDRLVISTLDTQSIDFDGGGGGVGGSIQVGVDIEFENSPFELYVGAGYERRAAGFEIQRSGQTGDRTSGDVQYQSNLSFSVGGSLKLGGRGY